MGEPKRGTKPNHMKTSNQKLVLDLIRRHQLPRSEIARITQLSKATVTLIVDDLISQGLVQEEQRLDSGATGRHPVQLRIAGDSRVIFSVCILREGLRMGLVSLDGAVLCERRFSVQTSPEQTLRIARQQLAQWMAQRALQPSQILGTGIIAPGPLQYREGVLLNPSDMPQWHNLPVTNLFANALQYPAMLERDTNALALEEQYFGQAQNLGNFMVLQTDVGVGSGIVIDSLLYRGATGMSSEIGHMSIAFDGVPCSCGSRGCLERYVSLPALLEGTPFSSWEALAQAADGGDPAARERVEHAAHCLAMAIVNAFNLFDLEKVFLTGALSAHCKRLMQNINAQVQMGRFVRPEQGSQPVLPSALSYGVRTGAMPVIHAFYHDQR